MPPDGFSIEDAPDEAPKGKKKRSRRIRLAALLDKVELWRSPDGVAHASVPLADHREPMRVSSRDFRNWLNMSFYVEHNVGLSGQALNETISLAEAKALNSRTTRIAWRRWADHEGKIYLDLGGSDPKGERGAVEIDAAGWRIIEPEAVPVAFLRAPDALPLPEPLPGEAQPADLLRFVNVEPDSEDLFLVWAWLMGASRPFPGRGAYPILLLHGEQGSGKSGATLALQSLIDPSTLTGRSIPREEHDLAITAGNHHLVVFDNLSGMSDTLSDCLCRLATGSGFSARAKYTDADEITIKALRPLLLNGIPSTIIARPDLTDRALSIELLPLRGARRTDAELATEWERARPGLLGVLCDGVSAAVRNLPSTTLDDPPRMADAATWAAAAAEGLGFDPKKLVAAWRANRLETDRAALAVDDVATALVELMKVEGGIWKGAPAELFRRLVEIMPERITKSPLWPKNAAGLGTKLRRIAPGLRAVHHIEAAPGKGGSDSMRWWSIRQL